MQLLQQLLTLISCCCSKLRVLATRAARWLMWKIYYLEVFSHFQSPRIKHQVLFEVGIQLENPEMSSDLDFDRKVSIVIALQKYHEKRQRSTTTKRDKKNSEGQIWWNRNCWISFLPCEGRMGTQTTVSQGITTITVSVAFREWKHQVRQIASPSARFTVDGELWLFVGFLVSWVLPIHHTSFTVKCWHLKKEET